MKYIIMCGGNYKDKFETPKQLLKVNGEILVERTIRLLKENKITDIAISTGHPEFDYLDVEKIRPKNEYIHDNPKTNLTSSGCWLNAYPLMDRPCCYLHGDVYFSENAIKTIVETKVKDTMFFCIRDISDGRPAGVNFKGREPLAYKVENNKVFNEAVNELKKMIDEGKFKRDPIAWNLYRQINGLDVMCNATGFNANNIFSTEGDYVTIDDYTTDIDFMKDIKRLEEFIMKGGENMIKVEVLKPFHLGRFKELKNIVRHNKSKNTDGYLYEKDTFECTEEMAKYLTNEIPNPKGDVFVEVKGGKPEKVEEVKQENTIVTKNEQVEEKPKKTTRRRRSVAKK